MSILFLIVFYAIALPIGIKKIAAMRKSRKKTWAGLTFTAFLILLPTWDVIVGRSYYSYLCNTRAGKFAYQKVSIPSKYFDEEGRLKDAELLRGSRIIIEQCNLPCTSSSSRKLGDLDYFQRSVGKKTIWPWVREREHSYWDGESGETIGIRRSYSYSGGWINRYAFPGKTDHASCPRYTGGPGLGNLVFFPQNDTES